MVEPLTKSNLRYKKSLSALIICHQHWLSTQVTEKLICNKKKKDLEKNTKIQKNKSLLLIIFQELFKGYYFKGYVTKYTKSTYFK